MGNRVGNAEEQQRPIDQRTSGKYGQRGRMEEATGKFEGRKYADEVQVSGRFGEQQR